MIADIRRKVKTFPPILNPIPKKKTETFCFGDIRAMISIEDLIGLIQGGIPDAEVDVMDKTGMRDHYIVYVTSSKFEGMNVMDKHRTVQELLTPAMQDGRLHAVEIKTALPSSN